MFESEVVKIVQCTLELDIFKIYIIEINVTFIVAKNVKASIGKLLIEILFCMLFLTWEYSPQQTVFQVLGCKSIVIELYHDLGCGWTWLEKDACGLGRDT